MIECRRFAYIGYDPDRGLMPGRQGMHQGPRDMSWTSRAGDMRCTRYQHEKNYFVLGRKHSFTHSV